MTKLSDLYEKFVSNIFDIGIGLVVLTLFILVSWIFKIIITRRVKPRTKNPLLAEFLGKIVALIITITGLIVFLEIVGLGGFAAHILAGAGITTFVIGFAFKDIGENFLAGILMAFKSPFSIGDMIETNETLGYVYELNLRETVVKTPDGKDVYIPNSQIIKNPLNNYTIDGFLRYEICIGLDYNTDFDKAIKLVTGCLKEIPQVLQGDKSPFIVLDELLASNVNLKIFYWIDTLKSKSKAYHLEIKSEISKKIIKLFNEEGISMPADIIEIKNYAENDLRVTNQQKR